MAEAQFASTVKHRLFADRETAVYAVIDGASVFDLLPRLDEHQPEHCCLFVGNLDPEVAATAPYLVRLNEGDEFTAWLIDSGWGEHWCIFAIAPGTLGFKQVRKHFRTFLRVRSPEGQPLLFRYYDPRVLRVYLPTCVPDEAQHVFGELQAYLMENEDNEVCLFRFDGERIEEVTAGDGSG